MVITGIQSMEIAKSDASKSLVANSHPEETLYVDHPSFAEAFKFWLKLGFISFGGPAGQISIMYQELVEKRRWVSNERFLNALNYCMLLPGPEAQQLAAYLGWLLHKIPGGIAAGALFLLPSMFILFGLSYTYAALGDIAWVAALFGGLKAAVMAVVVAAVIKIGQKALKNGVMIVLAAASFISIFFSESSLSLDCSDGRADRTGRQYFLSAFISDYQGERQRRCRAGLRQNMRRRRRLPYRSLSPPKRFAADRFLRPVAAAHVGALRSAAGCRVFQ